MEKERRMDKKGKRVFKGRRRRSFRGFMHLAMSFQKKMAADEIDVYSAQASFFLFMSIVPMLMIMLLFLRITNFMSEADILAALEQILNKEMMQRVTGIVSSLYHGSMTGMALTTFTLLFMSGRGMLGVSKGLNKIHHLKENRNIAYLRFRSTFYTLIMLGTLLFAMWMLVIGMKAGVAVKAALPFLHIQNRLFRFMAGIIMLATLTIIFNIMYTFLPNQMKRYRSQIYGAVFSTVSWSIFTFFFILYTKLAKNLSVIYGGLLTIGVTMFWLYWCLYLFFFGAELNAFIENPDSFPF